MSEKVKLLSLIPTELIPQLKAEVLELIESDKKKQEVISANKAIVDYCKEQNQKALDEKNKK